MWQRCVPLALGQEGLITLGQALSAGCSVDTFKRHVAKGEVERVLPSVYRLAGATETPRQKLRAVCLWGGEGTAASHSSAAALVGLKGFTLADLHAVTTKNPDKLAGWATLHTIPAARPGTQAIAGVPVTPPWITLIDLGSQAPGRRGQAGARRGAPSATGQPATVALGARHLRAGAPQRDDRAAQPARRARCRVCTTGKRNGSVLLPGYRSV